MQVEARLRLDRALARNDELIGRLDQKANFIAVAIGLVTGAVSQSERLAWSGWAAIPSWLLAAALALAGHHTLRAIMARGAPAPRMAAVLRHGGQIGERLRDRLDPPLPDTGLWNPYAAAALTPEQVQTWAADTDTADRQFASQVTAASMILTAKTACIRRATSCLRLAALAAAVAFSVS